MMACIEAGSTSCRLVVLVQALSYMSQQALDLHNAASLAIAPRLAQAGYLHDAQAA
jgi:hypothetical protein